MSNPPHRELKDENWVFRAREKRIARELARKKVARGALVNRFRGWRTLVATVTDAEGEPSGPWYLKFECVNVEWMQNVWNELRTIDFDLSAIPEAELDGMVAATQVLTGFLGANTFAFAYNAATPAWRWRLALVHRWFADRYVTAPAPRQSIYEVRVASNGGHFSPDQVGLWCNLKIAVLPNVMNWETFNGMLLDLGEEQRMAAPVPAALLSMSIIPEPWQARFQAVHFPAPEGAEIELEMEEADL